MWTQLVNPSNCLIGRWTDGVGWFDSETVQVVQVRLSLVYLKV
jgi:hypothetical protein